MVASDRFQRRIDRLMAGIIQGCAPSQCRKLRRQNFLALAERALSSSPTTPRQASAAATEAAPSTEPTSFANGRYQVKKFLGEGGKKKVYLAQDTLLDREVAFALI